MNPNEIFINAFLDELEKHAAYPLGTGWMKPGVQKIKPYAQRAVGWAKKKMFGSSVTAQTGAGASVLTNVQKIRKMGL